MMQKKLKEEDAKLLHEAADIIQSCFGWVDTDEGVHFWGRVAELLRYKACNRTSDGKPWVEPEPPIPEGWRKANADEYKRRDVQFWHFALREWMSRPIQGDPFDPPKCNTHYIVPIDPPLTDQDACVWPRLKVMVRDSSDSDWLGPYQYFGKSGDPDYPFVINGMGKVPHVWKRARRATYEEIEAAK